MKMVDLKMVDPVALLTLELKFQSMPMATAGLPTDGSQLLSMDQSGPGAAEGPKDPFRCVKLGAWGRWGQNLLVTMGNLFPMAYGYIWLYDAV